jgi:hypothetical protein
MSADPIKEARELATHMVSLDVHHSPEEVNRLALNALDEGAATILSLLSALQAAEARAVAAEERAGVLADHLTWVLPMAKGYAYANRVGRNAEKIADAESALSLPQGETRPIKMLVDADWLKRHVETDPDVDDEAGDITKPLGGEAENAYATCPACGAPAGKDCRTIQGRIPPHAERLVSRPPALGEE